MKSHESNINICENIRIPWPKHLPNIKFFGLKDLFLPKKHVVRFLLILDVASNSESFRIRENQLFIHPREENNF